MQLFQNDLPGLLSTYGYGAITGLIALESIGLPIPGATVLVAAAAYAGVTQSMDIAGVIVAASVGAAIGDNIAFWLGRRTAYSLLKRHGRCLGVSDRKLLLVSYLFQRHGGKMVFIARFIAILRVVTMYVAGISRMDWRRFVLFNLTGSVAWALVFGTGAYHLGQHAHRLAGPVSLTLLALGMAGISAAAIFVKRHIERLSAEAEIAAAGPRDGLPEG